MGATETAGLQEVENRQWRNDIMSDNPGMYKRAVDAANDYIREVMREDSFMDRILPPIHISDDELDRQVHTAKPFKIIDKQPGSMACITVPFGQLPMNQWIRAPRIPVGFDRVETPRFTADINELRTYTGIDIRQVLSDSAIKDLSAERDGKFMQAVNSICGAEGVTNPVTGIEQNVRFSGGITRETIAEAKKIMTTANLGNTNTGLYPQTALINFTTAIEFEKWERNEMGGDLSQEVLQRGWTEREWFGVNWIITIKRNLVPDFNIYWFAAPNFMGKNYILDDVTMYIRREFFLLEFFAYMTMGAAIGNPASVIRTKFGTSADVP